MQILRYTDLAFCDSEVCGHKNKVRKIYMPEFWLYQQILIYDFIL